MDCLDNTSRKREREKVLFDSACCLLSTKYKYKFDAGLIDFCEWLPPYWAIWLCACVCHYRRSSLDKAVALRSLQSLVSYWRLFFFAVVVDHMEEAERESLMAFLSKLLLLLLLYCVAHWGAFEIVHKVSI